MVEFVGPTEPGPRTVLPPLAGTIRVLPEQAQNKRHVALIRMIELVFIGPPGLCESKDPNADVLLP